MEENIEEQDKEKDIRVQPPRYTASYGERNKESYTEVD